MTILSWSYVVSLMLRVHIAEYIMWQLRVAYFQKYVSLKSLTTWDNVSDRRVSVFIHKRWYVYVFLRGLSSWNVHILFSFYYEFH